MYWEEQLAVGMVLEDPVGWAWSLYYGILLRLQKKPVKEHM